VVYSASDYSKKAQTQLEDHEITAFAVAGKYTFYGTSEGAILKARGHKVSKTERVSGYEIT
jgi:hypothetical protein